LPTPPASGTTTSSPKWPPAPSSTARLRRSFDGDGFITRAEYAAILVRALGIPEGGASSFSDVGSSDWYCGAVSAAVQYGIIKGYADGTFRPNANITREEAMAMLQRAAKVAEYAARPAR
jgi:hypothetical protein